MHELSIATQILKMLTRDLAEQRGKVLAVRLDVGLLSGVVPDALEFAWDVACQGTRFEGTALEMRKVPVAVRCQSCQADRTLPSADRLRCPICEAWTPDVIAGRELQIRSVEISSR